MTLREEFEKREANFMSPFGCLSRNTRGRGRAEPSCPIRTAFQVDKDRILYCNAFRRLKHKTQVFLNPSGDEYRTRLTHTLEVAQIARTIARAMFLNEDLSEAIALGHDLGHTPFGHGGEMVLKEIFSSGFSHQAQSLRVVQVLENHGRGLNLTYEVRDGIIKHSKGYGLIMPEDPRETPCTVEGRVVRVADIMAYLNHDLDDAIRSGVISGPPQRCEAVLGSTHDERVTTMMTDLIANSRSANGQMVLNMSEPVYQAMTELRQFLYDRVYRSAEVHNEFIKAKKIMSELYAMLMEDESLLASELAKMWLPAIDSNGSSRKRQVCDLLACMTDRYALGLYARTFFPASAF